MEKSNVLLLLIVCITEARAAIMQVLETAEVAPAIAGNIDMLAGNLDMLAGNVNKLNNKYNVLTLLVGVVFAMLAMMLMDPS